MFLINLYLVVAVLAFGARAKDELEFSGPSFSFSCPEKNGFFADAEQCDLYYVCEDNVVSVTLISIFVLDLCNYNLCFFIRPRLNSAQMDFSLMIQSVIVKSVSFLTMLIVRKGNFSRSPRRA